MRKPLGPGFTVQREKRRAWPGRPGGARTKAPLFPPSARQWHRKKLSFEQKITQAGLFPWGWVGTPRPPQALGGVWEAAEFPGADGAAGGRGGDATHSLLNATAAPSCR